MDDLFSILIYLIIIISFLSSIFKKKKPQNPPPQRRVPQNRDFDVQSPARTTGSDDYDILREIENMFKTGTGSSDTSPRPARTMETSESSENAPSSENINYEQYSPVSESGKTASEHEATAGEHIYQEYIQKPRKVDKKTEEQAMKFQALLERKTSAREINMQSLIKKIKNPASFREYIIVSEILGKPKAIRR